MTNLAAQGLSSHIAKKPKPFMAFAEIRTNVISGIVVRVAAIPLSIALAIAVGAPPIAGLYTSAFAG